MKICEVLISLVFGVLAGFIVALAVVIILDEALINYSYDMLYNFRAFFGG